MKRDFNQGLMALGSQLPENVSTLGAASIGALLGVYADEQNLPGEEKYKRGKLADRIYAGGAQEVSPDELALIRKLIGKNWPPVVVTAAWDILDRDYVEPASGAA